MRNSRKVRAWAQLAVVGLVITSIQVIELRNAQRADANHNTTANAHQADLTASMSAAGVMFPPASFTDLITENFDNINSLAAGTNLAIGTVANIANNTSVVAQSGGTNANPTTTTYTVTATNRSVGNALVWGGSGGTGRYASVTPTTASGVNVGGMQVNLPNHQGVTPVDNTYRYVGFWWSAGNAPNIVRLLDDGVVQATFTTTNILNQLGSAPAHPYVTGDYFGNPSRQFNSDARIGSCPSTTPATTCVGGGETEPYAFVHLRLSTGFDQIQFIGRGFEFDTVSINRFVPASDGETAIVGAGVVTTCANLSGNQANLTACPRSVTIQRNTNAVYPISPLLESQIPGYTYPAGTTVSAVQNNGGSGTATLSGDEIRLSSNTVGSFQVIYTLSGNNQTSRSTITVTVEDISTQLPNVLIADPRSRTLSLPSQDLSGSVNAMICIEQVADSSGATLTGSPTVVAGRSSSVANVNSTSTGNIWQFTGSLANVETQIPTITISGTGNSPLVSGASKFVRIGVTAASAMGSTACYTGVARVVEIRSLNLSGQVTNSLNLD